MKNFRSIISLFIILSLILFIAGTLSAAARGIHVVSKKGKELYLYKDYHVSRSETAMRNSTGLPSPRDFTWGRQK
jgi:hypothetical protein